jgi:hypothetical protein
MITGVAGFVDSHLALSFKRDYQQGRRQARKVPSSWNTANGDYQILRRVAGKVGDPLWPEQ